jgi:hypothetical protein
VVTVTPGLIERLPMRVAPKGPGSTAIVELTVTETLLVVKFGLLAAVCQTPAWFAAQYPWKSELP